MDWNVNFIMFDTSKFVLFYGIILCTYKKKIEKACLLKRFSYFCSGNGFFEYQLKKIICAESCYKYGCRSGKLIS